MKNKLWFRFLRNVLILLGVLSLTVALALLFERLGIQTDSIVLLFLLAVLFITVLTSSFSTGMVASVSAVMLINYFFTVPRYTFVIASSEDIILLAFFVLTTGVSGSVARKLQQQTEKATFNEENARLLYEISTDFLSVRGEENIVERGLAYVLRYTGKTCSVKLSSGLFRLKEGETDSLYTEYPICSGEKNLGLLRVYGSGEKLFKEEPVLKSVAVQMGVALEREQSGAQQETIRLAMEREKLKSTMLRGVAHDLRSPLTALSGTSSLLADSFEELSPEEQKKLAVNISEEMLYLNNLVENILNMTRVKDGKLDIRKREEVIDDVVSEAASHMEKLLRDRDFTVTLPEEVLMAPMDGKLILQVLINLLDNAIKHTRPNESIALSVREQSGFLLIGLLDQGTGIDPSIKDTLFDRFVTYDNGVLDGKRGMGLGLAICRAIVEAHGGKIWAENNKPKGAAFFFTLPMA